MAKLLIALVAAVVAVRARSDEEAATGDGNVVSALSAREAHQLKVRASRVWAVPSRNPFGWRLTSRLLVLTLVGHRPCATILFSVFWCELLKGGHNRIGRSVQDSRLHDQVRNAMHVSRCLLVRCV